MITIRECAKILIHEIIENLQLTSCRPSYRWCDQVKVNVSHLEPPLLAFIKPHVWYHSFNWGIWSFSLKCMLKQNFLTDFQNMVITRPWFWYAHHKFMPTLMPACNTNGIKWKPLIGLYICIYIDMSLRKINGTKTLFTNL